MARRKVQLPTWNISSEQVVDKEFLNSVFSGISQGELVINVKSGNTIITTLDEKDNVVNFESSVMVDEKINGVKEAIKELENEWGHQGPMGPQGADGANGADGLNGADGVQGPQGADGANGADGAQGPQGADGANGANGAQGPQGADGANGADGAQGPQGVDGKDGTSVTILGSKVSESDLPKDGNSNGDGYIINGYLYVWDGSEWDNVGEIKGPQGDKGETGVQGPQGAAGADGANGADGAQGPQGADGAQGPQGADGANGANGAQGPQGVDGANGADGVQGPQGAAGANGADGAQGPQGAAGADGKDGTSVTILGSKTEENELPMSGNSNGDGYIIGGYLYVWSGDKWNNVGEIKGPQGADGSQGRQGPQGPKGIDGTNGTNGSQGYQGIQGPQGPQGPKGIDGTNGTNGSQGRQGIQGVQGPQGPKGTDGANGADGAQGPQGAQGPKGVNEARLIVPMYQTSGETQNIIPITGTVIKEEYEKISQADIVYLEFTSETQPTTLIPSIKIINNINPAATNIIIYDFVDIVNGYKYLFTLYFNITDLNNITYTIEGRCYLYAETSDIERIDKNINIISGTVNTFSASTVAEIETLSGLSHSHENKDVLDEITSAHVFTLRAKNRTTSAMTELDTEHGYIGFTGDAGGIEVYTDEGIYSNEIIIDGSKLLETAKNYSDTHSLVRIKGSGMNLHTYSSAGTLSAITSYEFNAVSGGSFLSIFTGQFIDVTVTGLGTDNIKTLALEVKTGDTLYTVARGDHEHDGVYDVSGASMSALTEAKEYADNLVKGRVNSANTSVSATTAFSIYGEEDDVSKIYLVGFKPTSSEGYTDPMIETLRYASLVYMENGNIFSESDERLKDFYGDIDCDLEKIAKLPKKYFKYKNNDITHIGTSAQAVKELYPEIVSETKEGRLAVAYDKLSIIALSAVDKLYEENKELKERLKRIEEHLGL